MNREFNNHISRKVSSGGYADIGGDGWTGGLDKGIRPFFATTLEAPKNVCKLLGH